MDLGRVDECTRAGIEAEDDPAVAVRTVVRYGSAERLDILAGETARFRALLDGADPLRKSAVRAALAANDRTEALRIYETYLDRREHEDGSERLRDFVDRVVTGIRTEIDGTG